MFLFRTAVVLTVILSAQFALAQSFTLTSKAIAAGAKISDPQVFNGMGCKGGNVSPDLSWTNPPVGTKAFSVMVYDPDAPTGSGWWHWVAFNIPGDAKGLDLGASQTSHKKMPKGSVESRTDFGSAGYGGPCPPAGDKPHRYIFTVYALKDKLPLDKDKPAAMVGFYSNQMKLGEAKFEATYGR